jgi:hypothetical protein
MDSDISADGSDAETKFRRDLIARAQRTNPFAEYLTAE